MKSFRARAGGAATAALTIAVVLGTGGAAQAITTRGGGAVDCANRVLARSSSGGAHYHELSGVNTGYWAGTGVNGTTRLSTRNTAHESSWYVAVTVLPASGYPICGS